MFLERNEPNNLTEEEINRILGIPNLEKTSPGKLMERLNKNLSKPDNPKTKTETNQKD